MPVARVTCTTIAAEVQGFQNRNGRPPVNPSEMTGSIDPAIMDAMHTPETKPKKARSGYFYCYLSENKANPKDNKVIGIFAYPERYSKKYDYIFYRTNESGTTYTAEISDLFPGIEYGDPIPFYKTLVLEKDLPPAFKSGN